MKTETEKTYRLDNFDCESLNKLNTITFHFKQYYLELNDYVKSAINYYHGPIARQMAQEARVRVIDGTSVISEFTVKSGGNLARKESEVLIPDGVAENLINNHAIGMVDKERYIYRTGRQIIEINKFLDRDLVLAEIEYDPELYTEEDIDREMQYAIQKLDPNARVVDVTYDVSYQNKNLALSVAPSKCNLVVEFNDEEDDEEVNE